MEAEEATGREINNYLIVMKHVCKFCHKRFPCGRSLGGHMRSHLITNPSTQEAIKKEKVNTTIEEKKEKKKKNQLITPSTTNAAAASAAAGEFSGEANPKKINEDPNQVKCCKECRKAFQSSKALSGHMKSHAVEREKEKERQREKENSLLGGDEIEKDPKDQVMDRESDNEGVEAAPKSKCGPRRRTNRRQRYMGATTSAPTTTTTGTTNSSYNNINGGSSSVSEIDQQQQEDVAMCLIMLSRDVGPWGGVSSEFSDNNSIFLEPKTEDNKGLKVLKCVGESSNSKDLKDEGLVADEILSSGYQRFLEKMKSSELGKNLSSKSVVTQSECANPAMSRKRKTKVESLEIEKRSKFECTTCNKTFHSYQALGGHRASHKKNKGCSPLKPDGYETEEITDVSLPFHNQAKAGTIDEGLKKSVQIISKHECPVCFKEFSSGQALGGHKRSHLMATSAQLQLESNGTTTVSVVEKSNATTTVTTTTTTTTTTSSSHEVRDFLDLNLPAPVEEEHHQQVVGFKPWWVESTNKHEHLVSLISN